MLSIQHNMQAWNAQRQFNITSKAKAKKTEKLSSGYRVNRAADDAAGLAISEKMRRQIRGLKAGTENAQHGVSWVQIGEGALNEAHDILHRMNELTIKAQNETNTAEDKAYMEAEFNHLQSELDRISTTTTFNELNIFREHEPTYDQICGNIYWDHEKIHEIMAGRNQLIINYREDADEPQKTITLEVPAGTYTTHELIDELDDAALLLGSPIRMEYNKEGYCSLNLEGGEIIDTVTGDLQYLLWETYNAGGYGALIGTTEFENATDKLDIVQGQNDYMKFQIEYFDGSDTDEIEINLFQDADPKYTRKNTPNGLTMSLTKADLMDILDTALLAKKPNSGLKTSDYGYSIMLSSDKGIITGFKGNMFKIENKDPIYTSVFYDNIQEGYVKQDPAAVVGGAVLTTDTRDEEHNRYYINSSNNTLTLQPNLTSSYVTITIPTKAANANDPTKEGYTAQEMVDELNKIFDNTTGLKGEVKAYLVRSKTREKYPDGTDPSSGAAVKESVGDDSAYFEGVEIRTVKEGPDAIVNIDKAASTAYDTLFTIKNYNMYGSGVNDAALTNETKPDVNAYAVGTKVYSGNITINNNNNQFNITLRSTNSSGFTTDFEKTYTITLATGSKSLENLVTDINNKLKAIEIGEDDAGKKIYLSSRIKAEKTADNRLQIVDNEDLSLDNVDDLYLNWYTEIELSSAGGNSGYRDLFQKKYTYVEPTTVSGRGSLTLTGPATGGKLTININGTRHEYTIVGTKTAEQIKDQINQVTDIKFSHVESRGETKPERFAVKGDGTTNIAYYAGGTATGDSERRQGKAGYTKNTPAEIEIGPKLKDSMKVVAGVNDAVTLMLNGNKQTIYLKEKADGSNYTKDQLVNELQDRIDEAFGKGMDGALVSIKEDNQLIITSRLPSDKDGKETSITVYAQGQETNTFFDSLVTTETAASCTSTKKLQNSISLTDDGVSDTFSFLYTDSDGKSYDVTLDLMEAGEASPTDAQELVERINKRLNEAGHRVQAEKTSDGYLKLTTTGTGEKTHIEYTTYPAGNATDNATAIFGNLDTAVQTQAKITLDKKVKTSASFSGEKTFVFYLDGHEKTVYLQSWSGTGNTGNGLIAQLNNGINGHAGLKSMGVTASLDGSGRLVLTRDTPGEGSLMMDYDYASGGSTVMRDMFGTEKTQMIDGVTVSNSGDKLVITAGANDIISVTSTESAGMVKGKDKTGYETHDTGQGFHNPKYSTVTSVSLDKDGVELNRWNNQLKFDFTEDGGKTWKSVDFRLTESGTGNKTSLEDIKKELQTKIDAALGKDKVEVLLDTNTNKLSLKSVKAGAQYRFSGLKSSADGKTGGGFFHHVMCAYTEKKSQLDDPADVNGEQYVDDIFAQGRHDVVVELTRLQPNISDTLILDLTYIPDTDHDGNIENDKEKTISLTLNLNPSGEKREQFYNADSLKKLIQKKLNEAIKSNEVQQQAEQLGIQLYENLIEVDVGRHQTDIVGNKDSVSISFTLTKNPDLATPVEGYFYIDGIRGNAAYETFYRTEGELIPAYIIGTKDIRNGVVLGEDDTELYFVVDADKDPDKNPYKLKLDPGKYTAKELVAEINKQLKDQNIPLAAEITENGYLKISHQRMGKHVIEKVTGSARDEVFFKEHADKQEYKEKYVKLSAADNDRIELYSPIFSTMMLNINSICISNTKYAEKAGERLKEAISKVSGIRSTFGALQNRLEHAINNNQNKEENLQAAESRIRDADIAKEMVDYSNLNIIQQAGQAVLAQANQSRDDILLLLR